MIGIAKDYEIVGFKHAIRGMRNPLNSWDRSDSYFDNYRMELGDKDLILARKLVLAGSEHSKFRRMIVVYCDITAPLYWWKEFDTYKIGTVASSCSTMHTIHKRHLDDSDFSIDSFDGELGGVNDILIKEINTLIDKYNQSGNKLYFRQIVQMLPSSFNQMRTVMLNYEVLANIYKQRKEHKLREWRDFCHWIEELPYFEFLIKGEK